MALDQSELSCEDVLENSSSVCVRQLQSIHIDTCCNLDYRQSDHKGIMHIIFCYSKMLNIFAGQNVLDYTQAVVDCELVLAIRNYPVCCEKQMCN